MNRRTILLISIKLCAALFLDTFESRATAMADSIPMGWRPARSNTPAFKLGVDRSVFHSGRASGFIEHGPAPAAENGSLMQSFVADPYRGKRVRLTVYLRSKDVQRAFIFMSVQSNDSAIAYANTNQHALTENSDWTPFQITLDIPGNSRNIDFGVAMRGQGKVWIDDCKLEIVDLTIPNDDLIAKGSMNRKTLIQKNGPMNAAPLNMGFEEKLIALAISQPLLEQSLIDKMDKMDRQTIQRLKQKLITAKGTARVDCLNDIARELSYIPSTFKQAYYYSKQASQLAQQLHYQAGYANALMFIGMQMGYSQQAIDTIRRSIAIGESLHDDRIRGWGYLRLTNQYKWPGNEALDCLKKALNYFNRAGDHEGQTEAALFLCQAYSMKEQYEEAFGYCDLALEASLKKRTHNLSWGYGLVQEAYANMSDLYEKVGDYANAMAYLQKAKQYGIKMNLDWEMPDAIGRLYDRNGKHDSAQYLLKKNLSIQPNSFYARMFLGESFLADKQYDQASSIFTTYKDSMNWFRFYPQLTLSLGKVFESYGNYNAALPFARKGVALAGTSIQLLEAYKLVSVIYEKMGTTDSALSYLRKYTALKDSVSNNQLLWRLNEKLYRYQRAAEDQRKANEMALLQKDILIKEQQLKEQALLKEQKESELALLDKNNKLTQQQLKQEVFLKEQKEAKIALLNKDNKIKEQQLKQESLIRNFLGGGLLITLLTGFFIFRTLRLKKKNEQLSRERTENELMIQKLESEKRHTEMMQQATELEMQALRAQMSPHFIFNCLSSINKYILKNDTEAASDYLTRFSRLIRLVLINSQKALITLEDELDMLRLYIDMERLRFNNAFDYKISFINTLEPGALFVPPLLLQPFCENAIWHGLMHKEGHGKLAISLSIEDQVLHCCITDNGVGRDKAAEWKSKSAGNQKSMGLKITNDRLAILNQGSQEDNYYEMSDLLGPKGTVAGTRVDIRIRYKDLVNESISNTNL